jgi:anti-sigma factor RsiW
MNPDKLFDYLDGRLSPTERAELEQRLVSDPELQQELKVARQIHGSMRDSGEILTSLDEVSTPNRGAILGRRIAVVFSVLVFANVLFGIYAIAFMKKRERNSSSRERNRQELQQSLLKSAAAALPTPTFDVDEVKLITPGPAQHALADQVIAVAARCGGSAAKNLSDEHGVLLFAEIPAARLSEFRDSLTKLGAIVPTATNAPSGDKAIVQVRITDGAQK